MHINFHQEDAVHLSHEENVEQSAYSEISVSGKSHRYNQVAQWAVYIGAVLVPLFFLPWSTSVIELNKQLLLVAVAGVGLIAWLLGVVVSGQVTLRLNPVDKGVFSVLGAAAIASVFSVAKYKSVFGLNISLSESLVTLAALSIFYFLVVNVFEDRGRQLQRLFGVSIFAALAYGTAQLFGVYALGKFFGFTASRAFNTVGSVNTLGILAAVSLPLFAKMTIPVSRVKSIDLAKIGVIFSMVVLAVLNWWVLWAVAIAGMLALIAADSFYTAGTGQGAGRFSIVRFLLPMVVIILAVFLMIVKFNIPDVKNNLPVEIAPSQNLSADVAKSVMEESLVFGYGPENFSLAFDRYGSTALANTTLAGTRFFDSTSQAINFVIHGGILMVLAVLFMVWTLVELLMRSRRLLPMNDPQAVSGFTGALATVAALGVALLLYPFNLTLFFVLYATTALLVLAVAGGEHKTWSIEEKPVVSLASSLGFIVGLILVLAGSYFVAMNYLADVAYANALNQKDNNSALQGISKAINFNGNDDRFYRTSSQLELGLLSQELNAPEKKEDTQRAARVQSYIESAIGLAKQAVAVAPLESQNWANLGGVYESLLGLVENVDLLTEEAYLKAAELRPGDPSFYNRIGAMYLAKADLVRQLARSAGANANKFVQEYNASLEKAEAAFKKAIELAPNYGLAIYNLGAVYDRQGKVNEAIKEIEKIIPYNADQPSLLFELGLLYYRAGRKDNALAALQRAVLLSPEFANARWYLALIFEERKDYDSAIEQLQKILETNKDNEVVKTKLIQLEEGKAKTPPDPVLDQKPLQ